MPLWWMPRHMPKQRPPQAHIADWWVWVRKRKFGAINYPENSIHFISLQISPQMRPTIISGLKDYRKFYYIFIKKNLILILYHKYTFSIIPFFCLSPWTRNYENLPIHWQILKAKTCRFYAVFLYCISPLTAHHKNSSLNNIHLCLKSVIK
jgi:hypothetical protein